MKFRGYTPLSSVGFSVGIKLFAPLRASTALLAVALAPLACSTSSGSSGTTAAGDGGVNSGAACDSNACRPGNSCLYDADDKVTKCRLVCKAQTECPANYFCKPPAADAKTATATNYCAPMAKPYERKDSGQWGFPCATANGIEGNTDCDAAQKFACHAATPTDANAFCTQFDCAADTECPGGWYCATVNSTPNATTAKRSWQETRSVCIPREYCAPCKADIDCSKLGGTTPLKCIPDASGAGYCTNACGDNSNCQQDATCAEFEGVTGTYCSPNAGTCKGDGSFCSPCRSDADCPKGVCAQSSYSQEKFCTVESGVACKEVSGKLESDCPKAPAGANWKGAGCVASTTNDVAPRNHCYGVVQFGTDQGQPLYQAGCWTRNRAK